MKKQLLIIPLLFVLSLFLVQATPCEYTTGTDARDFFSVSNTTYNKTQYNLTKNYDDILFSGMTTITPRLNFSADFNETANFSSINDQHYNSGAWQLDYYNATNIKVYTYAGADITSQLTYTNATSSLTLNNASYNNTLLYIMYNRTFIKNVDNLVNSPGVICTLCGSSYELDDATPSYGQDIGFRVRDDDLAGNNWAVEWNTTTRTCNTETTCNFYFTPIFFLLGVIFILLMFLIIYYYGKKIKDGDNTNQSIITMIILLTILSVGAPLVFNLISNMHC